MNGEVDMYRYEGQRVRRASGQVSPPDGTRSGRVRLRRSLEADVLALQRAVGNRLAVQILTQRSGYIQRDGVTIEDVEDEDLASPLSTPVSESTGPLLLTDRPWAEIEQERRSGGVTIEDVEEEDLPLPLSTPVSESTGPLLLTDRPWAEIEQERDPRWQAKLDDMRDKPTVKPLKPAKTRRWKRKLAPVLGPAGLAAGDARARASELKGLAPSDGSSAVGAKQQELVADRARQAAARLANQAAEAEVMAKRGVIDEKAKRATSKEVTSYGINVDGLRGLVTQEKSAAKSHDWVQANDFLDQINDESAKLLSYATAMGTSSARITALTKNVKEKIRLRTVVYQDFANAVRKHGRDDADTVAKLTLLENGIQAQEDLEATDRLAVADKANKQARGLWPGNNRRSAIIAETTRATLGSSVEERAAVVEALDALKDPSRDHSWARKWEAYHGNAEGNLPGVAGGGGYKEYYVRPNGLRVGQVGLEPDPGSRRLVKRNTTGDVYYSHNHYGSPNGSQLPCFFKVTDA